jgi:UDP-N-acetylmuramyl pentapeptide synthase
MLVAAGWAAPRDAAAAALPVEVDLTIQFALGLYPDTQISTSGSGTAIVNADDRRVTRLAARVRHRVTFGFSASGARIRGKKLRLDSRGNPAFEMQKAEPGVRSDGSAVSRKTQRTERAAAAAVGVAFGVPARRIAEALTNSSREDGTWCWR